MTVKYADVMELVDVPDSKSGVGNYVPVRPRPSADKKGQHKSCPFLINLMVWEQKFRNLLILKGSV